MPKPLIHKMRTRSVKRAKQESEYRKIAKQFLEENPLCAVHPAEINPDFDGPCYLNECFATQVHHKKGRIGSLLTDVRYFLPVCDDGHRQIELNPEWAKEKGFSLSRLAKEEVSELKKV